MAHSVVSLHRKIWTLLDKSVPGEEQQVFDVTLSENFCALADHLPYEK
jgi:hypothetical protein